MSDQVKHPKQILPINSDGTNASTFVGSTPSGVKFSNPGRNEGQKVVSPLSDTILLPGEVADEDVIDKAIRENQKKAEIEGNLSDVNGVPFVVPTAPVVPTLVPAEYHADSVPATLPKNSGSTLRVV